MRVLFEYKKLIEFKKIIKVIPVSWTLDLLYLIENYRFRVTEEGYTELVKLL